MRITYMAAAASAVLFAAGCAHEQQQAHYDDSVSPSYGLGNASRQGDNNPASPSSVGNYSASENMSRSDNTLVSEAREALLRNPEIAPIAPSIQISANNGTVILSGLVQSDAQAQQVESIVQNTRGVVTVNNQLRVFPRNASGNSGGSISSDSTNEFQGSESAGATAPTNGLENPMLSPTSFGSNSLPRIYHDEGSSMDNSSSNAVNPEGNGRMP
jgi:hypothetical protein